MGLGGRVVAGNLFVNPPVGGSGRMAGSPVCAQARHLQRSPRGRFQDRPIADGRAFAGRAAWAVNVSADERRSRGGDGCVLPIADHGLHGRPAGAALGGRGKVITLCGSTKFEAEFAEVNQRLTMEGCVVISLGMFSLPDLPDYDWTADSLNLRGRLGGVHFQKIRMADEVYIVDPGGYIGESTRRKIAYAESLGKPVRYLSRERLARTETAPKSEPRPGDPLIGTTGMRQIRMF